MVWLRRLDIDFLWTSIYPSPSDLIWPAGTSRRRTGWRRAGSPFAEAMRPVRLHGARGPGARVVLLDRLGAVGTADRMRKELRRAGMLNVPKRPNEATRANFVRCSAHVAEGSTWVPRP